MTMTPSHNVERTYVRISGRTGGDRCRGAATRQLLYTETTKSSLSLLLFSLILYNIAAKKMPRLGLADTCLSLLVSTSQLLTTYPNNPSCFTWREHRHCSLLARDIGLVTIARSVQSFASDEQRSNSSNCA